MSSSVITLSVVIPTYNRVGPLERCLIALARQTYPDDAFEVVVVVDGSTDGTLEMLERINTPYPLHVCPQANQGAGVARNQGIEVATGTYCLFIDDDIITDEDLIAEHVRVQEAYGGVVGVGHLEFSTPRGAGAFARWLESQWKAHYAHLRSKTPPLFSDCYSGNLSAPRAALHAISGFAVDLIRSEDVELGYRLAEEGLPIVYIPTAVGRQEYDKGFDKIAADTQRAGVVAPELYRRHPPMLPHLSLARYREAGPFGLVLRWLFLRLPVPNSALAVVGPSLRRESWQVLWYRFLYDYFYWRGVKQGVPDRDSWRRLVGATPIFMYHAFCDGDEHPSRYVLSARTFARQMAWLRLWRYRVLSLDELIRYKQEHHLPPPRSVVITIDDGYEDNATLAQPILRRYDYPATIFLVTERVGERNTWDPGGELDSRPLMGWDTILDMSRRGTAFGAHTRTHLRLRAAPEGRVREEVTGSKRDLEEALGMPAAVFAYPYGSSDAASEAVVAQAGFSGACAVGSRLNSPATALYRLQRTEIRGDDSFVRFVLALALGRTMLSPNP